MFYACRIALLACLHGVVGSAQSVSLEAHSGSIVDTASGMMASDKACWLQKDLSVEHAAPSPSLPSHTGESAVLLSSPSGLNSSDMHYDDTLLQGGGELLHKVSRDFASHHVIWIGVFVLICLLLLMLTVELPVPDNYKSSVREGLVIASWVLVGVLFFMVQEGWDFSTSVYVLSQIVTTIGYGDVTPQTTDGRIFMMLFVLIGIVLVAGIVTDLVNQIMEAQSGALCSKMESVAVRAGGGEAGAGTEYDATDEARALVVASVWRFLFFLSVWVGLFTFYESCSCSYGVSKVPGCKEEECLTTSGVTKTFIEALYMGVITMTTVGFGDFTPVSQVGRIFGSVWMIMSVIATGKLVSDIALFMSEKNREKRVNMDRAAFDIVDEDSSGELNEAEFMAWVLVREGMVSTEELRGMRNCFQAIDRDKSGSLSYDEVERYFESNSKMPSVRRLS